MATPRSDQCEAALAHVEAGFEVFPCEPKGKKPITPHGFKDATADAAAVERMWAAHPDANIGVVTSGSRIVLDIDGADSRNALRTPRQSLAGSRARSRSAPAGASTAGTRRTSRSAQALDGLDARST